VESIDMAQTIKIEAEPREDKGTTKVRRLRRAGWLPGIVYGEGQARQIRMNGRNFAHALRTHTSEHLIMDLEIAGLGVKKVLLQDVQLHPVYHHPIHVDFHEVSLTKRLRIKVPLRLLGEPTGVTQQGGVLQHVVREIEVECLPTDIPEHVDVDVSALSIGDSLTAGNIKLDEAKFKLISAKTLAIASVTAPREEEVEVAAVTEGVAGEPEVLREKKEEGEEGAAEGAPAKEGAKAAAGKEGAKPAAGKEGAKPAAGAAKPAAGAAKPAGKEGKK
jgi:large subunit ribosomal protein L25